ncbi:VTC domain-containing protein [Gilbertella persicaria]|uniref:Vacuolar transporter chaperone n=1 Tax=Rhizopus stolonifer TaxID=4846 RepID=A0A367KQJ4_RHIST|nr:VTC domain-containing protein [Gilbertella persicaria]KAI8091370.1 VTC domain-containing protein [Gilbertella persicaria]RCI04441.1 vacuolar transporter chaperone [Rhizopus stolonifer]
MKFGEHLQQEIFPPWRLSYISYDMLKKELKTRQADHKWNGEDEDEFVRKLENELEKVYDFVSAKLGEVEARISYCERTIQTFINNPTWSSDQNWTIMDDALTEVLFDVNDLAKFTRLNYIGFQKIIKKHDKWTGLNLKQDFIPQLRSRPLDKQRFDVAIVFISALHELCRQRGKPRPQSSLSAADSTISSDEKGTTKYWIHPDNITEVKSIIMLHLPVSIFNKEKRYEASDSAVSSVYLDNDEFGLYTSLLQRDEGGEAIRFKWHGPTTAKEVYAERSTHKANWVDGASIKDRIPLLSEDVHKFISCKLTADEFANRLGSKGLDSKFVEDCKFVAAGVQQSIKEKHLNPVCRVFYNRTAFQLPDDPTVRINIDNDLTFIREDNFDGQIRRAPNEWRRSDVGIDYPFSYLDETEVLRFPYAVLESKIEKKTPSWLKKLLESHLVHEVPRFSKYLHGASYLFRDRIPLLPWWLSEMEIDIRKPRNTNFGLTRSKSFKPLIDGQYRRAMEAEELRMEIVQESAQQVRRSMDSSHSGQSDERYVQSNMFNPNKQFMYVNTNGLNRADTTVWDNRPHRMKSTLVHKGDDPLNYGPLSEKRIKRKDREAGNLGEAIVFSRGDIRLDIDPSSSAARRLFESSGMYVKDPNDPNGIIPVKKVKVEPKVFFSNERTFISWLQFCALLLTVALNLLNFGDQVSRIAGALFIGISAAVAIYALFQFEKRAWMINRRIVGRYDDLWGPAVLCVLLVGALVVNFYLRFR